MLNLQLVKAKKLDHGEIFQNFQNFINIEKCVGSKCFNQWGGEPAFIHYNLPIRKEMKN
jgi:hypothetical protein